MAGNNSNRRNFLKYIGLTVGTSLTSNSAIASFVDQREIRKLTDEQQAFMTQYGKWMDEFVEIIRLKKNEGENFESHQKMLEITEKVKTMQPALNEYMKDETFALIYQEATKRVTKEI